MKYDVLEPFETYLYQNYKKNTAQKYYSSVVKLFQKIEFDSVKEIEADFLKEELIQFKTRNEFSAVKNGLKNLKKLYPALPLPGEEYFGEVSKKKRNWTKKRGKTIPVNTIKRKINQLSNDKFKLAYRLALVSGLRVSELADLEARDIVFLDNRIQVTVRNGKGGHGGVVTCMEDPYLQERLRAHCEQNQIGKLFYSEAYLREKAGSLEMECHDLRRIFAITYRNQLKQDMPIEDANKLTQKGLRHARFSTTKRYLFNRKLTFQREEGKIIDGKGTG